MSFKSRAVNQYFFSLPIIFLFLELPLITVSAQSVLPFPTHLIFDKFSFINPPFQIKKYSFPVHFAINKFTLIHFSLQRYKKPGSMHSKAFISLTRICRAIGILNYWDFISRRRNRDILVLLTDSSNNIKFRVHFDILRRITCVHSQRSTSSKSFFRMESRPR